MPASPRGILYETIEFEPRRPVLFVARSRIGFEVIEAAPILNKREKTEIRVAEKAVRRWGRLRGVGRSHNLRKPRYTPPAV